MLIEVPHRKINKIHFPWVEFLLFSFISFAIAMIWIAFRGGSVSWDAFNHHLYLGRQALNGSRLGYDYFAAGSMSCQYPLGYALLVGMLDAGWSGTIIFQVLAIFSALYAPACWLIAWCIVPTDDKYAHGLRLTGSALALSGVLWWKILAQTSNDNIGMSLAIWAVALSMLCVDRSRLSARPNLPFILCSVAGLLAGLGLVVKLTQFISIVAVVCILLFANVNWNERIKYLSYFVVSLLVAVIGAGANWAYESWRFCGSPIYPFMLDFFQKTTSSG